LSIKNSLSRAQVERGKEAPRVRQARELTSLIDALDKTDRAVEVQPLEKDDIV
jgi:hypothetical protein